jgi:hypothetical protein
VSSVPLIGVCGYAWKLNMLMYNREAAVLFLFTQGAHHNLLAWPILIISLPVVRGWWLLLKWLAEDGFPWKAVACQILVGVKTHALTRPNVNGICWWGRVRMCRLYTKKDI